MLSCSALLAVTASLVDTSGHSSLRRGPSAPSIDAQLRKLQSEQQALQNEIARLKGETVPTGGEVCKAIKRGVTDAWCQNNCVHDKTSFCPPDSCTCSLLPPETQCYEITTTSTKNTCNGIAAVQPSVVNNVCNGRGVYSDEAVNVGENVSCLCYGCWEGANCETQKSTGKCIVSPVDPEYVYQEEWFNMVPSVNTVEYPQLGMYYTNYNREWKPSSTTAFSGGPLSTGNYNKNKDLGAAMEKAIRAVHAAAGNAETDGYNIVVGMGGHQMLSCAINAPSQDGPKVVTTQIPFWPRFSVIAGYANSMNATWNADPTPEQRTKEEDIIEIHTLPNNPNNKYPPVQYNNSLKITDRVYYWPNQQETTAVTKATDDIMIFTLPKVTSHPALRFGWALVKDTDIFNKMGTCVGAQVQAISDGQVLRATKIMQAMAAPATPRLPDFFTWSRKKVADRDARMRALIAPATTRFTVVSDFGIFFNIRQDRTPAAGCLPEKSKEENEKMFGVGNIYM